MTTTTIDDSTNNHDHDINQHYDYYVNYDLCLIVEAVINYSGYCYFNHVINGEFCRLADSR